MKAAIPGLEAPLMPGVLEMGPNGFLGLDVGRTRRGLPPGFVHELEFLTEPQDGRWRQVQGRTYAWLVALVECLCVGRPGARPGSGTSAWQLSTVEANDVARVVSGRSEWSLLALTCQARLALQSPFHDDPPANQRDATRRSLDGGQPPIPEELDWRREDARLTMRQKDRSIEDFVALVEAIDGVLRARAAADASRFLRMCDEAAFSAVERFRLRDHALRAYRWQCLACGVRHPRFQRVLASLTTPLQFSRVAQVMSRLTAGAAWAN